MIEKEIRERVNEKRKEAAKAFIDLEMEQVHGGNSLFNKYFDEYFSSNYVYHSLLRDQIEILERENKQLKINTEELEEDLADSPSSDALDDLWKNIIYKKRGEEYGDWEYPAQAARHILEEFKELEKEVKKLKESLYTLGDYGIA